MQRLVGDLDDDRLIRGRVRSPALSLEGVPQALADVAVRAQPALAALGDGALVFVVVANDQVGSHVWSLTAGIHEVRVQRGTPAPALAEIRTTFPAFLQLLAGTHTIEESVAAGRLYVSGDPGVIAAIEPFLYPDAADTPMRGDTGARARSASV